MLVEVCFPFHMRLLWHSAQLYDLSNTPGEVAGGEQETTTKSWVCLTFGDPLIGPSSEHGKHSSLAHQNLHATQHFLQSEFRIPNSGLQKLCKEIVAIYFSEILPKIRRHEMLSLLHRFFWEVARSLMGKRRVVCAQTMG